MRSLTVFLAVAMCFVLTSFAGTTAPAPIPARTNQDSVDVRSRDAAQDRTLRDFHRMQEKAANKKRQEDLQRDTDKLLQLATELKQYVDKTNENVLSIEVIKKAEEIEKLSKSVQKKMRDQ